MATQNINLSFVKTLSNLGKSSSPTPIDPTPQKGVYTPTKVVEQKVPSIEQFRVFSGNVVLPEAVDPSRFKINNSNSNEEYGSGVGLPINLSLDEMLSEGSFISLDKTAVQDFNYNFSFSDSARLNPDYFYQPELSDNSKLKVNDDYKSLGYAEEAEYEADSGKIDSASKNLSEADDYQYNVNAADEFYKDKETFEKGVNKSLGPGKAEKYVIPKGEVDVSRFLTNSVFVNKELESLDLKDSYDLSYAKKLSTLGSRSLLETIITDYGRYAEDTENTGYLKSATTALVELHTPTLGSIYDILKDKSYKENYDRVFSKKGNDWSDVGRGVARSAIAAASDIIKAANSWISTPILSFINIQLNRRSSSFDSIFLNGNVELRPYIAFNPIDSDTAGYIKSFLTNSQRSQNSLYHRSLNTSKYEFNHSLEGLVSEDTPPSKIDKKYLLTFNAPWRYKFRYGIPHYSIITDSEWSIISNSGGKLLPGGSTIDEEGNFKSTEGSKSSDTFLNSLKQGLSNPPDKNTPVEIHMLPAFHFNEALTLDGRLVGRAINWTTDNIESNFRSIQDIALTDGEKDKRDDSKLFKEFMRKTALLNPSQFNLFIEDPLVDEKNIFPAKRWNDKDIKKPEYLPKRIVKDSGLNQILNFNNLRGFRITNFEIPEISKPSVKNSYGNTALSLISNSQASSDHTAVITIICDKRLDELKLLNHLTGNSILHNESFISGDSEELVQVYELSAIADNDKGHSTEAVLQIINGSQIINDLLNTKKTLLAESNLKDLKKPTDFNFDDVESGLYKLPHFLFENFKFVDLDYDLSFEAGNDAKLLEIKATVTWTRLRVHFLHPVSDFEEEKTVEKESESNVEEESGLNTDNLIFINNEFKLIVPELKSIPWTDDFKVSPWELKVLEAEKEYFKALTDGIKEPEGSNNSSKITGSSMGLGIRIPLGR